MSGRGAALGLDTAVGRDAALGLDGSRGPSGARAPEGLRRDALIWLGRRDDALVWLRRLLRCAASSGVRQANASSVPDGETGAQWSLMTPSATQALSRGARAARPSHSRTAP